MNSHNLEQQIDEFENTPDGYAYSLRLDLSEIILRHLDANIMTQTKLAEKAQKSEQVITRIIHAASNCTFGTAANLLFTLGVKAKLVEVTPEAPLAKGDTASFDIVSTDAIPDLSSFKVMATR